MRENLLRYGRSHPVAIGVALVALVVLAAAPSFLASYYVSSATRIVIMGTFAVAFNLVFGIGGMPSLGHAAFFGTGGYVVGLGLTRWNWGFGTVIVVVLVSGAVLGLVFGLLGQRLSGIYLLLMTLALAQAMWGLAFQLVDLTGGDAGISGIDRDTIPFPVDGRGAFHYFVLAVCLVIVTLLWAFARSPVGRAIDGMRASSTRMAALGYSVGAVKLCAFLVSGVASALTGALYAYQQNFVGVEMLDWTTSATVLLAAIIGGARHFLGPALGMGVLIVAETVLSDYTDRWTAVLGLLYIIAILVVPGGILGADRRIHGRRRSPEPATGLDDDPPPARRAEVTGSSGHV